MLALLLAYFLSKINTFYLARQLLLLLQMQTMKASQPRSSCDDAADFDCVEQSEDLSILEIDCPSYCYCYNRIPLQNCCFEGGYQRYLVYRKIDQSTDLQIPFETVVNFISSLLMKYSFYLNRLGRLMKQPLMSTLLGMIAKIFDILIAKYPYHGCYII